LARREMRIAGFGGQGVVLAGQIVGQAAAVYDKQFAAFTQNYGPEARGGSCTAEIVKDEKPIEYPYLTGPEIVVILSQDAYSKYGHEIDQKTRLIIDPDLVKPDSSDGHELLEIPANRIARELGRAVVANIVLLGFVAAVSDFVSIESLRQSIQTSVPRGTGEFNLKAFEAGLRYGREHYPGNEPSRG
jgi:2-oxoglutarate ferredoxin oxidoreductase subunit gamma